MRTIGIMVGSGELRSGRRLTDAGAVFRFAVAATLLVVLAAGCSSQPDINAAEASGDGLTLHLEMASCNGDYTISVEENTDEVRVEITDHRRRSPLYGEDCASRAGRSFSPSHSAIDGLSMQSTVLKSPCGTRRGIRLRTRTSTTLRQSRMQQRVSRCSIPR